MRGTEDRPARGAAGGSPSDNRILPTGPARRHPAASPPVPGSLEDGREEEGPIWDQSTGGGAGRLGSRPILYPENSARTFDGPE